MIHEFEKLYAVSDLHLGGKPNRQAFRETDALCWLIRQAQQDSAKRVALLLNGDVVDFLAIGRDAKEFNLAPETFLQGLWEDETFKPIFIALKEFLAPPANRILILQVGNHDIELALPTASRKLLELLGAACGNGVQEKVIIETSGIGWTCRVGDQIVLAVHGNASDPWNEIDHSGLKNVVSALESRRPPESLPKTNAGTTLVIHVMNKIKEKYPFVDLLKPEGAPLMAVLKTVNARESASGLFRALKIRAKKGNFRELLATEEELPNAPVTNPTGEVLDFLASIELPLPNPRDALRRAERQFSTGQTPRSLVPDDDEKLGAVYDFGRVQLQRLEASLDRLLDQPDEPGLRRALRNWLAADESFDINVWSDIDRRIALSASSSVDILLAGHTHLPKELALGSMVYLNTGTWMRVLKLKGTNYLENDIAFGNFMIAVRKETLEALDELGVDPQTRPVAIVDANGARLYSVVEPKRDKSGVENKRDKYELKLMSEVVL